MRVNRKATPAPSPARTGVKRNARSRPFEVRGKSDAHEQRSRRIGTVKVADGVKPLREPLGLVPTGGVAASDEDAR